MKSDFLIIEDLGLQSYDKTLEVQLERVQGVLAGGSERLLLVEHHPVITLGRSHGKDNLLATEKELEADHIALRKSSRGGDITCHFPGQLVAYPVFRLHKRPGGLRQFFQDLENVLLDILSRCGIRGHRLENMPGAYVEGRKIASIGIGVKKWVSYHGFSVNLTRDLSLYSRITACGQADIQPTSIHREKNIDEPDMESLKEMCINAFRQQFAASRVD